VLSDPISNNCKPILSSAIAQSPAVVCRYTGVRVAPHPCLRTELQEVGACNMTSAFRVLLPGDTLREVLCTTKMVQHDCS
jgi:hypothetical protein